MYFLWHCSRFKSRCKCYQGSDTATSSLWTARESLQKITNKAFTIWNGNTNSHWYRNGRLNQAWEWEATSSKLLSAGKRGSNAASDKHLITPSVNVKVGVLMHISQRLLFQHCFLQLSCHLVSLLLPSPVFGITEWGWSHYGLLQRDWTLSWKPETQGALWKCKCWRWKKAKSPTVFHSTPQLRGRQVCSGPLHTWGLQKTRKDT